MRTLQKAVKLLIRMENEIIAPGFDYTNKKDDIEFMKVLEVYLIKKGVIENEADCDGLRRIIKIPLK